MAEAANYRRYPAELKTRAVAMVREREREPGGKRGAVARTAKDLGINEQALRYWINQDKRGQKPDGEVVPGSDSAKDARIRELEREIFSLRQANEILKLASAFFAQDLVSHPPPRL